MDQSRWLQVEALCHSAAALPAAERAEFLDDACGDDDALRRQVESLLAGESRAEGFLGTPAWRPSESGTDAPQDPMLGHVLGHYRIEEKLGEGGMGVVYRARDEHLERDVAIKVLAAGTLADQAARDRFRTEALSLSRLSHPNIATVHDFDTDGSVDFLVLEYLPGELLSDALAGGPAAEDDIVRLGGEIADALSAAHGAGVIHCDLKPGNLIVQTGGRVKVLDFGLARLRAPLTEGTFSSTTPAVVAGTLPYMSPEQLRGERVDERTDLYALGVVLYEMATGQCPYRETTSIRLADAILHAECEPPSQVRVGLSPWLEGVILKCLAKEPAERYQSAAELVADLRRRVAPPRAERVHRGRRMRVAVAIGATAVILAAAVLAFDVGGVRERWFGASGGRALDSIVVLPFKNISGDPEQDRISAGVAEEIRSHLARIQGLKVISGTSAEQYRDTTKSLKTIADELDVRTVLQASVLGAGGRLRIFAELIDAESGAILWNETYDAGMPDIFAVLSDVADGAVSKLGPLLQSEGAAIAGRRSPAADRGPTANLDAYDRYLRGISYYNPSASERQIRLSVQQFEEATRLDPAFTQAWARLAEAHACLWNNVGDRTVERSERARNAIDHALALQADLPDVHRALGFYRYWVEHDYERAVAEFESTLVARPGDSWAVLGIGWIRRRQGRFPDSVQYQLRGLELDPRSANTAFNLGQTYAYLRLAEDANRYMERALALDPTTTHAYTSLIGDNLRLTGDVELARRWLERAISAGFAQDPIVVEYSVLIDAATRDYRMGIQGLSAAPGDAFNRGRSYRPKALVEGEFHALLGDRAAARRAYGEARTLLEQKIRENPADARYHASMGLALAGLDLKEEAVREGRIATELSPVSNDALFGPLRAEELAHIYAMVGEPELALDQLEYLLSIPADFGAGALRLDPAWDPLRANPRFVRLLERASAID